MHRGQVIKYDKTLSPPAWACGEDLDTTLANTDTLKGLKCNAGQTARRTATGWQCQTTKTNTDLLRTLECTLNQLPKWTGGSWKCANDVDEDPIAALSCSAGQVARWNGSNWTCYSKAAPNVLNLGTYTFRENIKGGKIADITALRPKQPWASP